MAVILISASIIFSILRAVLPYATGYKNEIQLEISQQIGLPVEIDSIDAAIHWFSPRLKLIGVSVYDEKNKVPLFNFREAFVELDVVASVLRRELIVADIGLVGADLSIEKLSENEWLIQGINFTSEGSSELPDEFLYMIQNSDYLLHDSNIYYQDHTGKKLNLSLLDVNIDVKNNYENHAIKFSMNLPEEYGDSLAVVANLQGALDELDELDGDIYVEVRGLRVKQWNNKFQLLKTHEIDADIDISLWGTMQDNIVQTLFTEFTAKHLSVRNVTKDNSWNTNYLATNIRYVLQDKHWNIAISDFYFGEKSRASWERPVTLLAKDDDEFYHLSADFLRLKDLQDMAAVVLADEFSPELEKITAYQLQADIYNLNLRIPKKRTEQELMDKLYLDGSLYNFSIYDSENNNRLTGIDASVHFENRSATIDLVTEAAEITMPELFREPLLAETIQGRVALSYEDKKWRLSSSRLQVKNSHINTFSRFDAELTPDEDIFIDAESNFYDAYGKYAKHYYPVGIMQPQLVDWLDMAIIDGYVPDGQFILHGNLKKFPYRNHEGVFQVMLSVEQLNLRFLEQWPQLTDASANIKFNSSSLLVEDAKASTQDASLYNGYAQINDLFDPHLTVSSDAHAKNADIQQYVWNSPLDELVGNTLRLFQFQGESDLSLKIDVPLNDKNTEVVIDGHLNFIDSEIYYPALGYGIDNVNGVVDFTKDTLFADWLKAKIQGRPVSINAFTRKNSQGREDVFQLEGVLDANYLLHRYDWLPKDWVSGQSRWMIDVAVPHKQKDYRVHVQAKSQLKNVVLRISDKLNKSVDKSIDFSAEIDVLDNNGLHVDAKASDESALEIFNLYAVRADDFVWSFDVKSEYITGKGEFAEDLGKDSQLKLELDNIDVHSLFVTENKKKTKPLKPVSFPPLTLKAKKVRWDDWLFTDVNIETSWHEHGMLINKFSLEGPAMTFDAQGSWLTSWRDAHETVLQGSVTSNNFGDTLTGLGFQRSVDRCKYNATFDTRWSAEPYAFSWAKIKGKTSFEMNDGEILEVDPGAGGRLLGLLNIFKLTNRLAFDFDDVYRKGFSFDSIKGDFEFVNGDGSLKNFDVVAPAADINMFGKIGLVDRDYGLLMRVKPHTGSLTFASGTLLGGVVVGAGLALIEKVFDLGVLGHNVYSITGSWDDPNIEKIIERTQSTAEEDDF